MRDVKTQSASLRDVRYDRRLRASRRTTDTDKIGNHIDIWLRRNYIDVERKLCRNTRNKETLEKKRAELRASCCVISAMGRIEEFHGPYHDEHPSTSARDAVRIKKRPPPLVPYTHSLLPPPMSMLDLKEAVLEAQRNAASAESNAKKEQKRSDHQKILVEAVKSRSKRVAVQAAEAKKKAKCVQEEASNAVTQAANKLREFARQAQAESVRKERETEYLLKKEQAKVLRLGGQLAAASHEAGVHARREAAIHKKAQADRKQAEDDLRQMEAEVAAQRAERLRIEHEASKELQAAQAKVLRLGAQVAAASQEAAVHAQREAKAMKELVQERSRIEVEGKLRREAAEAERVQRRKDERAAEQRLNEAQAKLLRLGSQVAAAAQEAANMAREKQLAQEKKQGKDREVEAYRAEPAYLLEKVEVETLARRECARQRDAANQMRNTVKETSHKRLQAKKELTERLNILSAEYDEVHMELSLLRQQHDANAGAAAKLELMPTWLHERKTGKRGGGMQLQYQHRLAVLEQHANGTPPSAIGMNIVSVVRKVAPWLNPVQPSRREIQQIGFELPTLEEALAARRTAAAYSVRLLGFDETTDLQVPVVTSNVQIQDSAGSRTHDVVLKAAYLSTKGCTSEAVASEIEDKCFARLRELLRLWQKYHKAMFPNVEWSGPDVDKCSLHRLAGGGALISDTCNAARKTKRLLKNMIQTQAEAVFRAAHAGGDRWESMTEEARSELLRVHTLDFQHHLRNIWLGHMSKQQALYVQTELAAQLQQFSSWERMSTDYDQLLRAVYKEFHSGGRYYKGKGADFSSWMLEKHPEDFYMHIERADGGRQVGA